MASGVPTINPITNLATPGRLRLSEQEHFNSGHSSNPFVTPNPSGRTIMMAQQQVENNAHAIEDALSNKPRPQFIIKRVNTQELFDENPIRNSNMMGLSQINEENTGDIDEVMHPVHSIDLNDPHYSPNKNNNELQNIFKTEMVTSSKYKEFQKGPLIRDGQIIKHSICGSVETYEKFVRNNKKLAKENTLAVGTVASMIINPSERGSSSDVSIVGKIKHQPSLLGQSPRQTVGQNAGSSQTEQASMCSSERVASGGSSIVGKRFATVAEKKRALRVDLTLNKDQVIAEIQQIKDRQKDTEQKDSNKYRGLTLNDKHFFTKEERILQKHDKISGEWQSTVERLNGKLGREGAKSVMLGFDDHRQKKEMAEILDIIKTDEERYGSKYWYKTLRKIDLKSNSTSFNSVSTTTTNQRAVTAGSMGFGSLNRPLTAKGLQGTQVANSIMKGDDERPASVLEFIRKPRLIQTPAEASRKVEQFPGRTEKEYVNNKMSTRKHILKEIRPMETEGLGELIVQGKNKLELESGAMLKLVNTKNVVSVPKNFYQRHTPVQPEEIFDKKLDKATIMKSGLGTVIF